MGLTFSLGNISYGQPSLSSFRTAIDISVGAPIYDLKRFHVPYTNGNIVQRHGRTGQRIVAVVRYIGSTSYYFTGVVNARQYFKADKDALTNVAVTITDDSGQTYDTCNLVEFAPTSEIKATGRENGQVWFDARAIFTRD